MPPIAALAKKTGLSALRSAVGRAHWRHPLVSTIARAGVGAGVGAAVTPAEHRRKGMLAGAIAGGGSALAARGVRSALANYLRRQKYALTGAVGKDFKGTAGEYLRSIQSAATQRPELSLGQRASALWARVRKKAVQGPVRPAVADKMDMLLDKQRAGMSNIPDLLRRIGRDPKGLAKDWWRLGGKGELGMAGVFGGLSLPGILKEKDPATRRGRIAGTVGDVLGWAALGATGLPMTAAMAGSSLAGGIARRLAGRRGVKKTIIPAGTAAGQVGAIRTMAEHIQPYGGG